MVTAPASASRRIDESITAAVTDDPAEATVRLNPKPQRIERDLASRLFVWLLIPLLLAALVSGWIGHGAHVVAGYALLALAGFRLLWALVGTAPARIRAQGISGGLVLLVLLAGLLLTALTGLGQTWSAAALLMPWHRLAALAALGMTAVLVFGQMFGAFASATRSTARFMRRNADTASPPRTTTAWVGQDGLAIMALMLCGGTLYGVAMKPERQAEPLTPARVHAGLSGMTAALPSLPRFATTPWAAKTPVGTPAGTPTATPAGAAAPTPAPVPKLVAVAPPAIEPAVKPAATILINPDAAGADKPVPAKPAQVDPPAVASVAATSDAATTPNAPPSVPHVGRPVEPVVPAAAATRVTPSEAPPAVAAITAAVAEPTPVLAGPPAALADAAAAAAARQQAKSELAKSDSGSATASKPKPRARAFVLNWPPRTPSRPQIDDRHAAGAAMSRRSAQKLSAQASRAFVVRPATAGGFNARTGQFGAY